MKFSTSKLFILCATLVGTVNFFYFRGTRDLSEVQDQVSMESAKNTSIKAPQTKPESSEIFQRITLSLIELPQREMIKEYLEAELPNLQLRSQYVDSLKDEFQKELQNNNFEKLSQTVFLMNEINTHATRELVELFFIRMNNRPPADSETVDATRLFMLRILMENSDSMDIQRALTLADKSCQQEDGCQYEKDLVEALSEQI